MRKTFRLILLSLTLGCTAFMNIALGQNERESSFFYNDSTETALIKKLVVTALENYPEIKKYQYFLKHAEENLAQTEWSWLNTLELSWRYVPSNSIDDRVGAYPQYGIGITINVGSIINTPSRISQADQEVKIAETNIELKRNYLAAEVKRRYFRYAQNLDMMNVHAQSVDEAELMYNLIKHRYQNGEVGLDVYTKFVGLYFDAQENLTKTRGDVNWAKASLEEILGNKLEEIL